MDNGTFKNFTKVTMIVCQTPYLTLTPLPQVPSRRPELDDGNTTCHPQADHQRRHLQVLQAAAQDRHPGGGSERSPEEGNRAPETQLVRYSC